MSAALGNITHTLINTAYHFFKHEQIIYFIISVKPILKFSQILLQ